MRTRPPKPIRFTLRMRTASAIPLRRSSLRAFTLVELLAVVATIGVLAAILLLSIGRVRASASKATCAGHLRHLVSSSLLFALDHKKTLPTRDTTNHWNDWAHPHVYSQADYILFRPYLGNFEGDRETIPSLFCPGPLSEQRGPESPSYNGPSGLFITYAYYNLRRIDPAVLADHGMSAGKDLRRTDTISPNFPLWGCLTARIGENYMDHGTPIQPGGFSGQNVARADGSVHWISGDRLVPYITEGANVYHGPGR